MEQKVRNFRLSNGSFFINLTGLTSHQVLQEHRVFYLTNMIRAHVVRGDTGL